jgi:hypothetical protein
MVVLRQEKKTLEQHIEKNTEMVKEYTDDIKYDAGRFE